MRQISWLRGWTALALVVANALGASAACAYTVPYSTPEGITIVDVSKVMDDAIPQFLWRRLGDSTGNPLYTFDSDQRGKATCDAQCAKEFPPFVADANAKASGDFSIINGSDHRKQWAYQGKPLYRYSGQNPVGEPVGARIELKEDPKWFDPASDVFSPKPGWRRAAFTPEAAIAMPSNVELTGLTLANGFGFVDAATHMTIYAAPAARELAGDWRPLRASALAQPIGQFSIIKRKDDGTRQWTYRGDALYEYAVDYAPGEVGGVFTPDHTIRAALAYRNFMPADLEVQQFRGHAPVITNTTGQPIYMVSRYHLQYGGRETRDGYVITYNDAKTQGTEACRDDCTNSWKPVVAPKTAKGWGYWEVVARPDGVTQWAVKGCPIYTFVGDTKAGDLQGNNRYVIVFGGRDGGITYSSPGRSPSDKAGQQPRLGTLEMAAAVKGGTGFEGEGAQRSGAGFYWHTAGLFY